MNHIRCEFGIFGAHGEAIVELLALEPDLLAATAPPSTEISGIEKGIMIAVRISE
jgi:hypothetical protein